MPINQAALGATKVRDLSGLLGDERVEAVIGSEAGRRSISRWTA